MSTPTPNIISPRLEDTPTMADILSMPPPQTPPTGSAPVGVKVTLPTPPSFSTRRSQQSNMPKVSSTSPLALGDHDAGKATRRVSFAESSTTSSPPSATAYRIPQRQVPSPSAPASVARKMPPTLRLAGGQAAIGSNRSSLSPFSRSIPSTAPSSLSSTGVSSRFSLTAAAKGLSIDQALARGAGSLAATGGSIWSAGITGMGSGWISPALASARSTGTGTRARGLTVAVLKDREEGGKEMIMESEGVVSPPRRSVDVMSPPLQTPGMLESPTMPGSAGIGGEGKRKEIILCRYFHTPGLTCTSRPCRFVHSLDSISLESGAANVDPSAYRMLSPNALTPGNDPTKGTFAKAQAARLGNGPSSPLAPIPEVKPGEVVRVAGDDGREVVGTVFLMSGGGKGPNGKSRGKYKTVPCKDYAEGSCPYGEYCSFIHDEKPHVEEADRPASTDPASPPPPYQGSTTVDKSERRKSYNDALKAVPSAWSRAPVADVVVRPNVLQKHGEQLSAFAPPLSLTANQVVVNPAGELVPPPATVIAPVVAAASALPNAWSKGAPTSLKKVALDPLPPSLAARTPMTPINPTNQYLTVPNSAISLFGTDSDPATPSDPITQAGKLTAIQAANAALASANDADFPTLQVANGNDAYPYPPADAWGYGSYTQMFAAPSYPWGMPMSPINLFPSSAPGGGATAPEGQAGVLWTPSGWAVQDAAMKSALRDAEIKTKLPNVKFRQPKSYYRTKPCKFFAEGHCPHGDDCTYLHELPSASDTSSDSDKPHPPNYRTLPCKFFNSAAGCSNGESCTFLHTLVVPAAAPLVERPRPWRTRPCRHFQLNRCTLGDACHFAHVIDPTRKNINMDGPCPELLQWGTCKYGKGCKYSHPDLNEQQVELGVKIMRGMEVGGEEDEDSDDDVEIVTEDMSMSTSPPASVVY